MRTCTFCLATNADDAPYCATCGRSGPPARTDAAASAPGLPPPGLAPPQPPPPGFTAPPATPAGPPPATPAGAPSAWPYPGPSATPSGAPAASPYGPPPAMPYGPPLASPYGPPPAMPFGAPPPPAAASNRGPLVLVIGATFAALLLLLAAYLGSVATPTPKSGLKQARVPAVTVVGPRAATESVGPTGGARGR